MEHEELGNFNVYFIIFSICMINIRYSDEVKKIFAQTQTRELTQMSSGVIKSHKKDTAYFQKLQRDMQAQIHRRAKVHSFLQYLGP